ncbi:SGNH/GDSL hydrolase family protein [Sphingobacterium sp. SGG-5]|uniref:SGNH/GDSL hydrolase family protein n=1 Tax=Sphingobacterium sp. SGG-5 TaxID=2710881 RepID=UPI0013EC86E7|nr:SGNH/GDSL hydrolase family protein [Sphingobacterium sp. SGG-5]NGM63104.1 SGNH/GDSL hydrolase family protein [Sphingobacterium sp. SGG-5]
MKNKTIIRKRKTNNWLFLIGLSVTIIALAASAPPKKKVLIIGDSISIGYFPFVRNALTQSAEVSHNPGNARHTGAGLRLLDKWLDGEKYDLILFNWGLWDLTYRHPESTVQGKRDKVNGKVTFTVDRYKANMDKLVQKLKNTKTPLLFVTTTVVPPDEAGRFEGDEVIYNKAAAEVMKKYDVDIVDLHRYSVDIHKQYRLKEGDVHYTKEGYEELSKPIVDAIKKKLK